MHGGIFGCQNDLGDEVLLTISGLNATYHPHPSHPKCPQHSFQKLWIDARRPLQAHALCQSHTGLLPASQTQPALCCPGVLPSAWSCLPIPRRLRGCFFLVLQVPPPKARWSLHPDMLQSPVLLTRALRDDRGCCVPLHRCPSTRMGTGSSCHSAPYSQDSGSSMSVD